MDTLPAMVSFQEAKARLARLRKPAFGQACNALSSAAFALKCIKILEEIAYGTLDAERVSGEWLLEGGSEQLRNLTLEKISDIAPLDEAVRYDSDSEISYLMPATMGYPMYWDDWYDTIENLDSVGDDTGFWFFARCLLQEERESFEACAEHFGWELGYPAANDTHVLNIQAMYKRLKRRGLGMFITAWKIANYDTGNIYFDYNYYEDNEPLPDFSADGVRALQKQYLEALPIQEEYRRALDLWREERIPGVILGIYRRSLEPRKKMETRTVTARTLAEMWAGEEQEMERTIDPFYGPLDGMEDETDGPDDDD